MSHPSHAYSADLAYIHDTGFGGFARQAASGVLAHLRRHGIRDGLVVDLGCGSGLWASRLLDEGYEVHGVDVSAPMLAIARRRAPAARFVRDSFLRARLPHCRAITALGECFNYAFDPTHSLDALGALFARARAALDPGGLLIFDMLEPGRRPPRRSWHAGEDWAVLVSVVETRGWLLREMVIFRQAPGGLRAYRRSAEQHRVRLLPRARIERALTRAGFAVQTTPRLGRLSLGDHHVAFIATAPRSNSR